MADKRLQALAKAKGVDKRGNKPQATTGDLGGSDGEIAYELKRLAKENRAIWTTFCDMECEINKLEDKFKLLQDEIEALKDKK